MSKWYDKLNKTHENTVRCFVSLCNENPLDNEKLIVANIWSRIELDGQKIVYTEYSSGNHYRYAIPCEDAVPVFFNSYLESINNDYAKASFIDFFEYIHEKPIDGMFWVEKLEENYNQLMTERR